MMTRRYLLLLLCIVGLVAPASAGVVVVVHAGSPIQKLSRQEVVNIYMGRFAAVSGGERPSPVDLPAEHEDRSAFYQTLVNKNLSEINAYWSRLIFSGKTAPPLQSNSASQMFRLLTESKNLIGYIDASKVPAGFRVVHELTPLQ